MDEEIPKFEGKEYSRACLLVGRFMYHFALLESAINDGIGKLLSLGPLEMAIATFNMQFRAKMNVLKAIVKLRGGEADWAKAAINDIEAIVNLSVDRNTVAHTVFGPDKNDTVRFLTVKARDELKYPNTVWSIDDFRERWDKARELRDKVDALVARMTTKGPTLSDLLLQYTNEQRPAQAGESPLVRLLLGIPDSEQSTSEEDPQTHQESEGREQPH
jgi:hypothetical protein